MHQEHNIPWATLASHFTVKNYPTNSINIPPMRIVARLPTQANALNHFVRIFRDTITTFSKTERLKYDGTFPALATGSLISDALQDRHRGLLNERNRYIENWIRRDSLSWRFDLQSAILILLGENELEPLLMLAQHPRISMRSLHQSLCDHYNEGFLDIVRNVLPTYLELNLWAAMGLLEGGEYLKIGLHTHYSRGLFQLGSRESQFIASLDGLPVDGETKLPMVHRDMVGLKEYLKTCFRVLYQYDMFMKECGLDPEWEKQIVGCFILSEGVACAKYEYINLGSGKYTLQFS